MCGITIEGKKYNIRQNTETAAKRVEYVKSIDQYFLFFIFLNK